MEGGHRMSRRGGGGGEREEGELTNSFLAVLKSSEMFLIRTAVDRCSDVT
jgi:hypothetical protein